MYILCYFNNDIDTFLDLDIIKSVLNKEYILILFR